MNLKELARKAISTLFLSMLCLVAFAQTATGLVKDKTGEPMIGVNVLVKGTTNGTITDFDGKFSIPDVPSNATLVVSYIGYLTKEVKSGKDLVIVLEEDNKTLDEVVVIGYGTVKRRDLTGSVASVTGEKLAANPVANVAQALQGQLPGVSVTSQDGRPGAGMSIRIRGGGSITQSNDPLFIVDGVQVSGIDDIPADNIESIDVLKDAASTAIYGARGANGVILVTTKGGKDGRVSVKYNMYYQMKENPKLLETMDPYDYVYNTWAYMKSLGDSYGDGVARYFGLGSKYGNHLNEYKNMTTHNYINDLMQTASSWNHDVSLSGGTDKTKFYSSVNYMDDEGIRVKSGFQRWNANFKLTQKINKKLTADFDLRYSEIEVNGSGFGNATSAYTYRPVDNPLGDASFTAGFGQGDTNMEETSNPLYYLDTVDYIKNMYRIRAKGALTWNIIKGLTAKTELSLNRNWNQEKTWDAGQTEKDNSSAKLKKSDGYGVRWATTLNYEVQGLGDDHNLSFLVGNEVLASKSDYTEIYGVGYPEGFTMDDAFGMINMTTPSLGQDYFKGEIGTPNHTLSWFGRANYSYKGKYLFTFSNRWDGVSQFSAGHKWDSFPAGAIAWRISDEPFMNVAKNWLNNLKLRVGYGITGNSGGVDAYGTTTQAYVYTGNGLTLNGQNSSFTHSTGTYGSKDLGWEKSYNWNVGLDYGILNNRVDGSIEWFKTTTKGLLFKRTLPITSGLTGWGSPLSIWQNIAETSNQGVEVTINSHNIKTKDFSWNTTLSVTWSKEKIEKLPDGDLISENLFVGHSIKSIYGYKYTGIWGTNTPQDILDAYGVKPGFIQIETLEKDGDGGVHKYSTNDRQVLGHTNPDWIVGLNNTFTYKNFDLSVFAMARYGQTINSDLLGYYTAEQSVTTNQLAGADYWTENNQGAYYPAPGTGSEQSTVISALRVRDGSFIKVKNITLGYTFPVNISRKALMEKCRIYATAYNPFIYVKDKQLKGTDPETNGSDAFPTFRQFVFGVNLTF